MGDQTMIRLDRVTKVFGQSETPAVTELSLEVERGEMVALVGPSGCGKTTTLKMINRLIEPTSGRIEIDGRDATAMPAYELRRSIGYVIQQVGLFPHRTIAQNIATVPELLGWDSRRIEARVQEMVDLVGLDRSMLGRYPPELSGGQQQRVGVARALAADPPVLLMDEPFGAVDPIVRGRLQSEFRELQGRLGKTVVLVTHDVDEAIFLGSRIAILDIGGVLEQFDAPEEILANPANEFVRAFIGEEPGLRRLALRTVGEATLSRGPVVDTEAGADEARRVMGEYGTDWVGLTSGDRLLGWVDGAELDGRPLAELACRPFLVTLQSESSLRAALDSVVTSHARVAVVVDDGVYRGMLGLEAIAEEITE